MEKYKSFEEIFDMASDALPHPLNDKQLKKMKKKCSDLVRGLSMSQIEKITRMHFEHSGVMFDEVELYANILVLQEIGEFPRHM